jgi:outer membrane protein assembly factor BamB
MKRTSWSLAMVALDAATGATLWTFHSGASVDVGPSIVDGRVYWGVGDASKKDGGTEGHTLYAFCL